MRIIKALCVLFTITVGWYSCTMHDLYEPDIPLQINLRWVKSYPAETPEKVVDGLMWNLSYLGAMLPANSVSAFQWRTSSILSVDFSRLGFSSDAGAELVVLFDEIKKSEEYKVHNAIDVGRFVMLTLNSSYHYFAITGVPSSLEQFRRKYRFQEVPGAVINSSISQGHRKVWIAHGGSVADLAFIAAEGTGSIIEGNFVEEEFETLDIMPNGQLRFGLYDKAGKLKASASADLSLAGKPAKCLWCHEINLQSLNTMGSVPDYLTYEEFKNVLDEGKKVLTEYRETLNAAISFFDSQNHTLGELLYIGFMEPSVFRLTNEWDMSETQVTQITSSLPTHQHHEFPFLGDKLFRRESVEQFLPFSAISVPEDAREPSAFEPQIIQP